VAKTATLITPIACRLAGPDEGPLVKALFTKYYEAPCEWLQWDIVSPHWILAEQDGTPTGMAMVGIGSPFGWIELLMVDPVLSVMTRGRIVMALKDYAYAMLRELGVSGVLCTVADGHESFHQFVQRQGFVPQGHGTVYLKRLL